MSAGVGWVLPVPGVITFDARPDGVLTESAGGAATSGGAVATETFGACANSGAATSSDSATNGNIRMSHESFRSSILPVISFGPYLAGPACSSTGSLPAQPFSPALRT